MNVKDLIKLLEAELEKHKPYEDVMGELDITIDLFKRNGDVDGIPVFTYAGFGNDIKLHRSNDGVYLILNRFVY